MSICFQCSLKQSERSILTDSVEGFVISNTLFNQEIIAQILPTTSKKLPKLFTAGRAVLILFEAFGSKNSKTRFTDRCIELLSFPQKSIHRLMSFCLYCLFVASRRKLMIVCLSFGMPLLSNAYQTLSASSNMCKRLVHQSVWPNAGYFCVTVIDLWKHLCYQAERCKNMV